MVVSVDAWPLPIVSSVPRIIRCAHPLVFDLLLHFFDTSVTTCNRRNIDQGTEEAYLPLPQPPSCTHRGRPWANGPTASEDPRQFLHGSSNPTFTVAGGRQGLGRFVTLARGCFRACVDTVLSKVQSG